MQVKSAVAAIVVAILVQRISVVIADTVNTGGADAHSVSPNGMNGGPNSCGDGPCRFVGTQAVMTFDELDIKDGIHGFGVSTFFTTGSYGAAYFEAKSRTSGGSTDAVYLCRIGNHEYSTTSIATIRPDIPKVAAFISMSVHSACRIEKNCIPPGAQEDWFCGFTPPHPRSATNEEMLELNVHAVGLKGGWYTQVPQGTTVMSAKHFAYSSENSSSSQTTAYDVGFSLNEGYYFGQSNPISTNSTTPAVQICQSGCGGSFLLNPQFVPYTDNHHHYGAMNPYWIGDQIHVYDVNGDGHKVCLRSGPPGSGCEPPTATPTVAPTPTMCRDVEPPKSGSYDGRVGPYTLKHSTITPSWLNFPLPSPTPTIITILGGNLAELKDDEISVAAIPLEDQIVPQDPEYYSSPEQGCATHRVDPINFVIWNDAAGYFGEAAEIDHLPWPVWIGGGRQNIKIDSRCLIPDEKTLGLNRRQPTAVTGQPSPTPDRSQLPIPLRWYQYHVRAAQSCRLTAANGHYERIDWSLGCPWWQGFHYHIIEANGYNRGRDQAVQDLLATGLYDIVRVEFWNNTVANVNCDGSRVAGDGRVTILERK